MAKDNSPSRDPCRLDPVYLGLELDNSPNHGKPIAPCGMLTEAVEARASPMAVSMETACKLLRIWAV